MRETLIFISFAMVLMGTVLVILSTGCQKGAEEKILNKDFESFTKPVSALTITVAYDNNPFKQGLETAWGFSCVVKGTEKTILFDTGGDGSLLIRNMQKLKIDPKTIDVVVLSHIHGDHVGGLSNFLAENPNVVVYVLKSFPKGLKKDIHGYKAEDVEVQEPLKICENVYSTGELGTQIKEQSLIIHTNKGVIVITGCAHPGIVKIVEKAKDLIKDDVLFVMGGFHLGSKSKEEIEKIVLSFKKLGVDYVGPCHCSGDTARELFKKEYQQNYVNIGVGKVITLSDLK
ncbi:MAG: MBL fold metallo-hydrolase [Acidobacteriota bacterium]|nr:MBL fold metallo-hydrolase [Acidobacteriota bacterium]